LKVKVKVKGQANAVGPTSIEGSFSSCYYDCTAAVDGGKLMSYFNLPWFAWGSPETHLGDPVVYNTHVRVTSPYDRLATAVVKLFVYYNVRTTTYLPSIISLPDIF